MTDQPTLPGSPAPDDTCMEDTEFLAKVEAEFEAERVKRMKQAEEIDEYKQALDSYPNPEMAEKFARLNGYANFEDAYNKLGYHVWFTDEPLRCNSQFILRALCEMGKRLSMVTKTDEEKEKKDY